MSDGTGIVDVLTAGGTVGAATVAAVAVVVTGRQGQKHQRLLVEAQQRDVIERRADFELGVLMELSTVSRSIQLVRTPQPLGGDPDRGSRIQALLIALPPEILPTLRAAVAPRGDTVATERFEALASDESYPRNAQRAIDRELRDAIFERRDLARVPGVSERLAGRRWYKPRTWRT